MEVKGMPFIRFETRAVEDRAESLRAGEYRTKDVDFIIVIPAGSAGKLVLEEEYAEWIKKIKGDRFRGERRESPDHPVAMQSARFPDEWLAVIEDAYQKWKMGQEVPETGTPIKLWPALSPSQRERLLSLHVTTVEALANAPDGLIEAFGMGGRTLRQRAQDFLKLRNDPAAKTAAELEKLRKENESLQARIKALEAA